MSNSEKLAQINQERNELLKLVGAVAQALIEQHKLLGTFHEIKTGNIAKNMFMSEMIEFSKRESACREADDFYDWE